MSEIDEGQEAADPPGEGGSEGVPVGVDGGILGNLPNSRPSIRSPRRAATEDAAGPARTGDRSHTSSRKADRPSRAAAPGDPAQPSSSDSHGSELEALARGGVAVAGAVAAVGLRVAGRAAARLRDAIEPR